MKTYNGLFLSITLAIAFSFLPGVTLCHAEVVIHIVPAPAVEHGAQWHILSDPETWYDPNTPVSLPSGMHTIAFKNLPDWAEPASLEVVDAVDTLQTLTVRYSALTRLPLGQIPDHIAWQGQPLEFMVYLADANDLPVTDAILTAEGQPAHLGDFSFTPADEPGYSVLSYTSAAEEVEDFQIILEGRTPDNSRTVCQLVRISPMQTLTDETIIFKTGQHTQMISGVSSIRNNEDVPGAIPVTFNYKTNTYPRTVRIEGDHIEVSRYNDDNKLYLQLCAVTDPAGNILNADIKTLEIIADVLVIKTRLWLPGTQVTIKAVELYFEDEDPAMTACIVTTPAALTTRPALPGGAAQGVNGQAGLNAGDITIDVMEFHSAELPGGTVPQRFILDGGSGQPAGHGRNGIAGPNLDYKDSFHVRCETWAGTDKFWTTLYSDSNYKITSVLYRDHSDGWDFDWDTAPTGWSGSTTLPHGGNAVPGGYPGAGGNAGQLKSTAPVDTLYSVNAGPKGQRAQTYPGGQRGTPLYYLQLIYDLYGAWMGSGSCDTNLGYWGIAQTGAAASAPDDSGVPNGQGGGYAAIASTMEQFSPENFTQNLNIIRQFYLANQIEVCKKKIDKYIQLIDLYKQREDWNALPFVRKCRVETIYGTLRSMQNRIENGLDYYGNPAGWAPMLSFEVNRTIFDNEIDRAIDMLYLSYWLKEEAANAQERVDALTGTIEALKDEIITFKQRYDEAVASMPDLETEAVFLKQSIEVIQGKLHEREEELRRQAQNNLREPWWKTGLKIAGSICSMIPVYQPALGAIGGGMTLAANFDEDDPWATITGAADLTTTLVSSKLNDCAALQKSGLDGMDEDLADDEQQNEAFLSMLSDTGNAVTSAFSQISSIVSAREAPKSKIDAELARLAAEDETFQALADEIKDLLDRKAALSKKIASAVQDISSLPIQISTNVQAINSFVREKASGEAALSNEAAEYLTALENRANDRLIKYHYYLAKGYEYRLLKPYKNPLDLTPMFNKFKDIAQVNTQNGYVLRPDQFASLKAIYEDLLSGIAEEIFDEYNRNARPEYTVKARFNLLPEELEKINAGQPLILNPMDIGIFNGIYEENLRLIDLSVYAITADPDNEPVGDIAYVDLRIEHPGESKLKSNGTVYLFRYSEGGDSRPIEWGGRYNLVDNTLDAIHPSAASESLLRSLLEGDAAADMMLYSRPSAWSDLKISKSSVNTLRTTNGVVTHDNILIRSLRLEMTYDFVRKNTNLAEIQVSILESQEQDGQRVSRTSRFQPYLSVSRTDENGRQNGRGQFLRIYRKSPSDTVTLSAQPVYGSWMFCDWVDQQGQPVLFAQPGTTDVTLPLTSDYKLFARYIPGEGLAGDLNTDRRVDIADFALLARFHDTFCNSVKFDGVGIDPIDTSDFLKFSEYWLMDAPSSILPAAQGATPPASAAPSMPADRRAIEVVDIRSTETTG